MKELNGKVILVVDDEVDLREIMSAMLTGLGATVQCAENGADAFEYLQQKRFDIVISDMRMPGGDGLSLIKNIDAKMAIKPKIILCTGYSDISEAVATSYGVKEIVPKPFSRTKIIDSIMMALELKVTA